METDDNNRKMDASEENDAATGDASSPGKNLTVQQRLMKHPVLLCILIPVICIVPEKFIVTLSKPAV